VLRPLRRLLIFTSAVTLALNVADPLVPGEYGKAAFDAVGPLLLIGWAEVGPGFLQALSATKPPAGVHGVAGSGQADVRHPETPEGDLLWRQADPEKLGVRERNPQGPRKRPLEVLLDQARREDAAHRAAHQKPISADTLRVRLGIGATQARRLVKIVRAEFQTQGPHDPSDQDAADESHGTAVTVAA
jgi:hypothetical protein